MGCAIGHATPAAPLQFEIGLERARTDCVLTAFQIKAFEIYNNIVNLPWPRWITKMPNGELRRAYCDSVASHKRSIPEGSASIVRLLCLIK